MTWGYQSVGPAREEFPSKEVMGDGMFWVVEHVLLHMVTSQTAKDNYGPTALGTDVGKGAGWQF